MSTPLTQSCHAVDGSVSSAQEGRGYKRKSISSQKAAYGRMLKPAICLVRRLMVMVNPISVALMKLKK
eukprot:scaffold210442_cov17-Tisochrysis_lutea.AAC.2